VAGEVQVVVEATFSIPITADREEKNVATVSNAAVAWAARVVDVLIVLVPVNVENCWTRALPTRIAVRIWSALALSASLMWAVVEPYLTVAWSTRIVALAWLALASSALSLTAIAVTSSTIALSTMIAVWVWFVLA
jgi:hypothetical protein